jgi:hypothetical protein
METSVSARPSFAVLARLLPWAVGFVIALWLCVQWGTSTSVRNDFTQNVWLPSRLVLEGVNPYNPSRDQVNAVLGDYSSAFRNPDSAKDFNSGSSYHFIYPIWVALVFTPFGALPLTAATALWRAANLVLLVWAIRSVLRSANPVFRSGAPAAIAAIAVTILASLLYRESILTLYLGQFSIIELGLLAAVWSWFVSSQSSTGQRRAIGDGMAGISLAVLATKPQSVGLAVVLFLVWSLSRRRWIVPAAAIVTLMALLVAPLAFYPGSLGDWLGVVFGRGQAASQVEVSASVWGLSYQWLGAQAPWAVVAGALTIGGLLILVPRWWSDLKDKTSPVPASLALTLCINSVISPYMLGYEHVVLLLPALLLLARVGVPGGETEQRQDARGKWWRMGIYSWMVFLPIVIVLIQSIVDKEYPVIIQSASMLVICWFANFRWKPVGLTAPAPSLA